MQRNCNGSIQVLSELRKKIITMAEEITNQELLFLGRKSGMDCECVQKVEKEILEFVLKDKKNKHKDFQVYKGNWERQSLFPRSLYINFLMTSTYTTRSGKTIRSQYDYVSIHFSYCPFCGKPLQPASNEKSPE